MLMINVVDKRLHLRFHLKGHSTGMDFCHSFLSVKTLLSSKLGIKSDIICLSCPLVCGSNVDFVSLCVQTLAVRHLLHFSEAALKCPDDVSMHFT